MITVSALVPFHDVPAPLLEGTLFSLRRFNEVIGYADTHDSELMCRASSHCDTILYNPDKKILPWIRKRLIDEATSEYIVFHDSDDIRLDTLEDHTKILETYS